MDDCSKRQTYAATPAEPGDLPRGLATRYIYEPANRDEVIATFTQASPQVAAATYDLYIKLQVIAREAALFDDGIKANFDALVAMGDLTAPPPLPASSIEAFLRKH